MLELSVLEPVTFYLDADTDGFGRADSPIQSCTTPEGYVQNADDCDESKYPGAGNASDDCNENLFNYVYACNVGPGNGPPSSRDGYTFFGRGFIHLTGKGNYETVSSAWNKDSLINSSTKYFHIQESNGGHINELTDNIEVAMHAAMYFCRINNVNTAADDGIDKCNSYFVSALINNPSQRNRCNNTSTWRDLNGRVNAAFKRYNLTNKIYTECL